MASGSIKIDSVPLPDMPVSIEIPVDLLQEFKMDARIIIRHPWVVGIPVPDRLFEAGALKKYKDFELMLVPKAHKM